MTHRLPIGSTGGYRSSFLEIAAMARTTTRPTAAIAKQTGAISLTWTTWTEGEFEAVSEAVSASASVSVSVAAYVSGDMSASTQPSSSAAAVAAALEKREQAHPSTSPVVVSSSAAGTWNTALANSVRITSVLARRRSSGSRAGKSRDGVRPHSRQGLSSRIELASVLLPMATVRRR